MKSIIIETIPHSKQVYPTAGDWRYENGKLVIRVSEMGNDNYEFLVALHELVEVKLCEWSGITQEDVDKFDMDFEAHRHPDDDSEPGDSPNSPYRVQHCIATGIERLFAALLGVDWKDYEKSINALFE